MSVTERELIAVSKHQIEGFFYTERDPGLQRTWETFIDLCNTPRSSGNEAQAIDYVRNLALSRSLEVKKDEAGNILIELQATECLENTPGIVFQGHLDMVADGEPDPAIHGVTPFLFRDDDGVPWVTSAGNTILGADNGIGVAMMVALMQEEI